MRRGRVTDHILSSFTRLNQREIRGSLECYRSARAHGFSRPFGPDLFFPADLIPTGMPATPPIASSGQEPQTKFFVIHVSMAARMASALAWPPYVAANRESVT